MRRADGELSRSGPSDTAIPALDGLRAIAVALVLRPWRIPGMSAGSSGDVSSVLSGFLITSLRSTSCATPAVSA
ncbi:hypothetical protein BZL30_9485 [Mycobacterium kansasii]|uniref:Uncharacterized protein n=1 Tax=Mycobacterium kansasii TaxID=1768 RepID=A0A1V3W8T1_MYCKA|nr:hypothetical protein BZL30_9485 [Mycobacterium kansasii]